MIFKSSIIHTHVSSTPSHALSTANYITNYRSIAQAVIRHGLGEVSSSASCGKATDRKLHSGPPHPDNRGTADMVSDLIGCQTVVG